MLRLCKQQLERHLGETGCICNTSPSAQPIICCLLPCYAALYECTRPRRGLGFVRVCARALGKHLMQIDSLSSVATDYSLQAMQIQELPESHRCTNTVKWFRPGSHRQLYSYHHHPASSPHTRSCKLALFAPAVIVFNEFDDLVNRQVKEHDKCFDILLLFI